MTLLASVGQSYGHDGREAGLQAMRQALEGAGRTPVVFGWLIASHAYALPEVLAGASDLLSNVPLLGFSTSGEITLQGRSRRSVVIGLLCADDARARAAWAGDFVQDSRACLQGLLAALKPDAPAGESLLLVADGLGGDHLALCEQLPADLPAAGCLAGGELWRGRTYQAGGRQAGSGGLAGAVLAGNIVIGQGAAHGWQPVGAPVRLTRVQGHWIRTLDHQPASETYARLFGFPAREWSHPPLSELARLYPLGVSSGDASSEVLAPLRVEADGSLRMNRLLPEGRLVDVLVGSLEGCRAAAGQAARQALAALEPARPRLAVLLVDAAWQTLLELDPHVEADAVRAVLGPDVPLIGGCTFGQLTRPAPAAALDLLNQHILVLLFGAKTAGP
ncbi:MAG: FIST signal transduction protein [Chloroflexota bacterium]